MLCREYRVGSLGEFFRTLKSIEQTGRATHLPRSFVLGAVSVHIDAAEYDNKPLRLEEVVATLERDGNAYSLTASDGTKDYNVIFKPRSDAMGVFPDQNRFTLFGDIGSFEGMLIVHR